MIDAYPCWSRQPRCRPARVIALTDRCAGLPPRRRGDERFVAYGNGRSYSDVCLTDGGTVLAVRGLDRFISFDRRLGVLRCEAGVLLADLLALVVPAGWFPGVTPGTRYVTVGGAIANDVHGKNHHRAGSFGCHVRAFELLRSDGARLVCSQRQNADWFAATVGGLGLTGLITWAEMQLVPIGGPYIRTQTTRFGSLQEFWSLSDEAESRHAYTVAWVDCLSRAGRIGQGLCFSGDHAPVCARARAAPPRARRFPIDPPFSLVNRLSLTAFNFVYWRRPLARPGAIAHMESFFYPLDRIDRWNRIYGRQGFYQYQCVVPEHDAIEALLQQISASGQGSFLAVLKAFGSLPSPGLLSFARPGFTLALDFPNRGPATTRLFERLDSVVVEAGGALYPAKDSRMPAAVFRKGFPAWERFLHFRDPAFSSSFARRVGLEEPCRAP